MDLFFETVASLMSMIMRRLIENTLNDLMDFLINYKEGNKYDGVYDIFSGLALPHRILPFRIYYQPDRDYGTTKLDPNGEELIFILHHNIDMIVNSLREVPRVEYLLFQGFEESNSNLKYLNMVENNQDITIRCKNILKNLVLSNSFGPKL